ncbi:hypothetical protein NQ314_011333 [Rhamnusium bicolor]|uniref:SLC12A transporter C-terminal domain-containing protein n=1 Tax=Rhamnusium bicolor TaxID=1586634 RepID=A0AAV8XJF1_9CUCU|nr:hypothetical protein NQ314_011333 [Rhamnusium bicolor]
MSTRRNWSSCKLRVFALANKRDELELEHRNMASLLAKFRIDYTDLQVVPDITAKPRDSTQNFFDSLIADFKSNDENEESSGKVIIICISQMSLNEKPQIIIVIFDFKIQELI